MPLYEYKCDGCGEQFEKLVRASSPAVACPSCGGEKLGQQYSTFAAKSASAGTPMPAGGCGAAMCGTPGYCGKN